ncbi:MAG: DPP IV N-terminal domain-containing protein [Gemmatimonadaceae bacterium]
MPFAPRRILAILTLASTVSALAGAQTSSRMPVETYRHAQQMLAGNAELLVLRDKISPNWIGNGDRFWYRVRTERGSEFDYVDLTKKVRRPAFDHARLAASLAKSADTTVMGDSLPFQTLDWLEQGKLTNIRVMLRGKAWRCDLANYACDSVAAARPPDPNESLSPDGKWALFTKEHNLWVREAATGALRQLTSDGAQRYAYAGHPQQNTNYVSMLRIGMPSPPVALWSKDSRKVLVHRIDERNVPMSYLVQNVPEGTLRPKLWSFAFPFPGDSAATARTYAIDVANGRSVAVQGDEALVMLESPIAMQQLWWGDSLGTVAYILLRARGMKSFSLVAIDALTGTTRTVATERGPTFVETTPTIAAQPNIRVTTDGKEVIWYSERDGWGELYLLDAATGTVKNRITTGEGVVRSILKVDDKARRVWFVANGREAGRDPYLRHLYSVAFDGTRLALLSPEDADHDVTLSPNERWFIDRYSRVDLAPVIVARSLDGKAVVPIERADVSRLIATGWRYPERFVAKAADGKTDIYGIIIKPAGFDSTKRYPLIEEIYPGPQAIEVAKSFTPGNDHRALVELGMIGVEVDGRGTPYRSKAFHNYSYGNLETGGGLEDHLSAYKEIAATRPWMDMDCIGIYGHSGGGFASTRAILMYPDFYKVAFSSAGNHDQRGYVALWGETYQGIPNGDNYVQQANVALASRLKGKLMLSYADMDDNVPPALTIQLIDALTRANKEYDLLVIPNGNHGYNANPYLRRRRWDYFVTHLMGRVPPADFKIIEPLSTPRAWRGSQP